MRSVLLLLTLLTGCAAVRKLQGCKDGWINYTWKCGQKCRQKDITGVEMCKKTKKSLCKTIIKTQEKDTWFREDRFSLFYDTKNKAITVAIKELQENDKGEHSCGFVTKKKPENVDVKLEVDDDDGCQKSFHQTTSISAATTIACNNPGDDFKGNIKFFCKEFRNSDCEEIVSTTSPSNGSFTLTENSKQFNMTISATMPQHAGVYWCGVKAESYRAGLKKIQLQVQATRLTVAPSPVSSTQSTNTTPAHGNGNGSRGTVSIIVIICVALLVLVLLLVFKRFVLSKNTIKGAEQNNKEDHVYEEIQEHRNNPDSAVRTIYATANHPTNTSTFVYYTNVNPENSSDQTTNSAVKVNQGHDYSTVNHPPQPSRQVPLYSTVSPHQL